MDTRTELPIAADAAVMVRVLGADTDVSIPGRLIEASGRGLKLEVPVAIPNGTAVKIEADDLLLRSNPLRQNA